MTPRTTLAASSTAAGTVDDEDDSKLMPVLEEPAAAGPLSSAYRTALGLPSLTEGMTGSTSLPTLSTRHKHRRRLTQAQARQRVLSNLPRSLPEISPARPQTFLRRKSKEAPEPSPRPPTPLPPLVGSTSAWLSERVVFADNAALNAARETRARARRALRNEPSDIF